MRFSKATYTKDDGRWKTRMLYAFPETLSEYLLLEFVKLDFIKTDKSDFDFEKCDLDEDDFWGAFQKEIQFETPDHIKDHELSSRTVTLYRE